MPRTYSQPDLDDRRTLFRLVEARRPVGEIAGRLGRHPSTIHRELGRDRFRDGDRGLCGYFPLTAHDLARGRRRRRRKLAADDALRARVVERLRAGWSPQQVAGRLQREAPDRPSVCHVTGPSTGTSTDRMAVGMISTGTCPRRAGGAGPATAASPGPPRSRASAGSRTGRPRSSGARASATGSATCCSSARNMARRT